MADYEYIVCEDCRGSGQIVLARGIVSCDACGGEGVLGVEGQWVRIDCSPWKPGAAAGVEWMGSEPVIEGLTIAMLRERFGDQNITIVGGPHA